MIQKKLLQASLASCVVVFTVFFLIISGFTGCFSAPAQIAIGDCADVEYIGRFAVNNTVFETTYDDVVNKTGGDFARIFVNPNGTLSLPSGYQNYSSAKVNGFLNALVSMTEGENKTVLIPAEDAYGTWNVTLAVESGVGPYPLDSVLNSSITENKTLFYYDFPSVTLAENTTFDYGHIVFETSSVLYAKITQITDTDITYQLLPVNGTSFLLPLFNWNVTFFVTNSTQFTIHSKIKVNHTFSISTSVNYYFKIIEVNDTSATIAMNIGAPDISFIDQPLRYEIKVLTVYKTSQQES
ncbi:MAG: FKBP-type peptidyl-prolyl cis-trans isomerase [Methanobacteriota archaeon]